MTNEQAVETTKVVFRKFPKEEGSEAEVIALFPGESWDRAGNITSYMHMGQHAAASPSVVSITKLATPEEYAPLKAELEGIGYVLKVGKTLR